MLACACTRACLNIREDISHRRCTWTNWNRPYCLFIVIKCTRWIASSRQDCSCTHLKDDDVRAHRCIRIRLAMSNYKFSINTELHSRKKRVYLQWKSFRPIIVAYTSWNRRQYQKWNVGRWPCEKTILSVPCLGQVVIVNIYMIKPSVASASSDYLGKTIALFCLNFWAE